MKGDGRKKQMWLRIPRTKIRSRFFRLYSLPSSLQVKI